MLQQTFTHLIAQYTTDEDLIQKLWIEIEQQYCSESRYYHTLQHLDHLLKQLLEVKSEIENWNIVLFSLFYHDIIYKATASDNEEQSAALAVLRMKQIFVPSNHIEICQLQILATKKHLLNDNTDVNYFTDADLSVLGMDWDLYKIYFTSVRKEYAVYPDLLYNAGRKKVLQHFLDMDHIYKTDYFGNKFEKQAKLNLQKELDLL